MLCGLALGAATPSLSAQDELPGAPIRIAPVPDNLAAVDLDGDRKAELVSVQNGEVCLLFGGSCDPLPVPGRASLWTVADWDGDGYHEFLVLVDGKALHRVVLAEEVLQLSAPLAEGLDGTPPLGIRPASFVRDLDANGHPDLIVPRADRALMSRERYEDRQPPS